MSKESVSENKSNIFIFDVFISFITMDGKPKNRGVESILDSCVKSSSKSDLSGDHAESGHHVEPHEVVSHTVMEAHTVMPCMDQNP